MRALTGPVSTTFCGVGMMRYIDLTVFAFISLVLAVSCLFTWTALLKRNTIGERRGWTPDQRRRFVKSWGVAAVVNSAALVLAVNQLIRAWDRLLQ